MPSSLHELIVEMLRSRPALVADLLALTRAQVPAHDEAVLSSADLADVVPAEYRADAVIVLQSAGRPVYAVIGEIQRQRDEEKRFTWPVYLAGVRARFRCPAAVLVVCPDSSVAAWAERSIELDLLDSQVRPRVLGPNEIPVVLDPLEAAINPALAVLSAVAHGNDPAGLQVIEVAVGSVRDLDYETRVNYLGTIFAGLTSELARAHLEALVNSTVENSEFVQWLESRGEARGEARGKAKGLANGVLAVLTTRGVSVSDTARDRILASTDLVELDRWIRAAATATTVEELFEA